MALLFADGFDHYDDNWEEQKYESTIASLVSAGLGRRGGGALLTMYNRSVEKSVANKTTLIVGTAWTVAAIAYSSSMEYSLFHLLDGTTKQLNLRMANDISAGAASLSVYRGGTLLGTTAERVLIQNKWQYIEMKATIDSISGSVEVRVDGETVLSLTGINTQATANAYASSVRLGFLSTGSNYCDDFYICDDQGSVNNDFLGDVKVVAAYATSDGTHTDFVPSTGTAHYATVDEELASSTDYNEGSNLNDMDTYGFTVPAGVGSIKGIQVTSFLQNTDVGTRKTKTVCRSNSTDYLGSNEEILSNSWSAMIEVFETDPADSGAWTTAKIEAAEFGVKITE